MGALALQLSLNGCCLASQYVARLQRRQEMEKLRNSVAGKSVSERLMHEPGAAPGQTVSVAMGGDLCHARI